MASKQVHQLPLAGALSDADQMLLSQSSQAKRIPLLSLFTNLLRKTAEYNAQLPVYAPAAGTFVLVDLNRIVGDVLGVDIRMAAGSCTATFQIADDDGSNAAAITGLSALSVTTTRQSAAATAARTLQIAGTADRQLLLVLASVVGAGPLLIGVRYQRASGA